MERSDTVNARAMGIASLHLSCKLQCQAYFPAGSLTGMWREVLTTRGLPSGWLWLLIVSRSKMNFSASMCVASMNEWSFS